MSLETKHHLFIEILMLSIMLTLMFAETMANQNVETQQNFLAKLDTEKLLRIIQKDQNLRELILTLANDKDQNLELYNEFYKRLRASYKDVFGHEIKYKTLCTFKICNMGVKRRTRSL